MVIREFESGPLENKFYILFDDNTREALLIDAPYDSFDHVVLCIKGNALRLKGIVLTHGHWDHTANAHAIRKETSAKLYCHYLDENMIQNPMGFTFPPPFTIVGCKADSYLEEKNCMYLGDTKIIVYHAPGHSPGHVILYEEISQSLFSGDVIFNGSIGRTDFPGGDFETLMTSIQNKVLTLPSSTTIYPGHGPKTTIDAERKYNPFINDYFEYPDHIR